MLARLRSLVERLFGEEKENCPKCATLSPFVQQWGRYSCYDCPKCGEFKIKTYDC